MPTARPSITRAITGTPPLKRSGRRFPTSSTSLTGISSVSPMPASGIFAFLRRFRKFTKRLKLFGEPAHHLVREKQMSGRRTRSRQYPGQLAVRGNDKHSVIYLQDL